MADSDPTKSPLNAAAVAGTEGKVVGQYDVSQQFVKKLLKMTIPLNLRWLCWLINYSNLRLSLLIRGLDAFFMLLNSPERL